MSSGNILTVTDVLNFLVSGINKITLETELTASGWISTPARGDSKSGAGTIWTSPNTQYNVRMMTQPDGSSYARVYNDPRGCAPAEQPLNASEKPGSRGDTHFILLP